MTTIPFMTRSLPHQFNDLQEMERFGDVLEIERDTKERCALVRFKRYVFIDDQRLPPWMRDATRIVVTIHNNGAAAGLLPPEAGCYRKGSSEDKGPWLLRV